MNASSTNLYPVTDQVWIQEFLIAEGITWEIGPPRRYDESGADYVTLDLGGPHFETYDHDRLIIYANSSQLAKKTYRSVLLKFLDSRRHIVWRIEPEIVERKDGGGPGNEHWFAYSRLTARTER